jgi:diguanylate cyclase (GGDEF)-like protein
MLKPWGLSRATLPSLFRSIKEYIPFYAPFVAGGTLGVLSLGILLKTSSPLGWLGLGLGSGIAIPYFLRKLLPLKKREESYPPLPLLPRIQGRGVERLHPAEWRKRKEELDGDRRKQILGILSSLRKAIHAHAVILFRSERGRDLLYPEIVESYEENLELLPAILSTEGLVGYAFREVKPILAQEIGKPLSGITYYPEPLPVHSLIAVPLVEEGVCVGVLLADSFEIQAFTEETGRVLSLVAEEISRLNGFFSRFGELSEELLQWQAFFEVAQRVHDQENLEGVIEYFLDLVSATLNPHWTAFVEEVPPSGISVLKIRGESPPLEEKVYPSPEGWILWALREPGMREISDLSQFPSDRPLLDPGNDPIPRRGTLLIVPLSSRSSLPPSGVLLFSARSRAFAGYERGVLQRLLAPFSLAYERQRAMEELKRLATTDALTGLWNRRVGMERFEELLRLSERTKAPLGIILFDVDRFKRINDTYGHDAGDEVLRTVARIARKTLRTTDIIARYGGEEFLALLPSTDMKGTFRLAERLRKALMGEKILLPDGRKLKVTASFGVTTFEPDGEKVSMETLLKSADEALYRAKRGGRNRVEKGSPSGQHSSGGSL